MKWRELAVASLLRKRQEKKQGETVAEGWLEFRKDFPPVRQKPVKQTVLRNEKKPLKVFVYLFVCLGMQIHTLWLDVTVRQLRN